MAFRVRKKSKSKFFNKEVIIDGINFKSIGEGNRYSELKILQRTGEISQLECHPHFILFEKETISGINFPSMKYTSDFKYLNKEGKVVIEEYKSIMTFAEKDYKLRRRIFCEKIIKPSNGDIIFKETIVGQKRKSRKRTSQIKFL